MVTALLLAAAMVSAIEEAAVSSGEHRTPLMLREAVDEAMQREAAAADANEREAAVRELIELVREINANPRISEAARQSLGRGPRVRLARIAAGLERPRFAAARPERPASVEPPDAAANVLAQAGAFGPGQAPGRPPVVPDHGNDLAQLIREVIAPDSWVERGGNGVILYFNSSKVLVVRQTGEVHDGLADLLRQLNRN